MFPQSPRRDKCLRGLQSGGKKRVAGEVCCLGRPKPCVLGWVRHGSLTGNIGFRLSIVNAEITQPPHVVGPSRTNPQNSSGPAPSGVETSGRFSLRGVPTVTVAARGAVRNRAM